MSRPKIYFLIISRGLCWRDYGILGTSGIGLLEKIVRGIVLCSIFSYETAIALRSMLQTIKWDYVVVDEGHRLKNCNCRLGIELRKIPTKYRLLLTGTPLQNDMEELWSLLNFLQPDLFDNYELFAVCTVLVFFYNLQRVRV